MTCVSLSKLAPLRRRSKLVTGLIEPRPYCSRFPVLAVVYKDYSFLGYDAIMTGTNLPTVWRTILPLS